MKALLTALLVLLATASYSATANLSWTASPTPDVTYRVYVSDTSGGYTFGTGGMDVPGLTAQVPLADGVDAYMVVTAINAQGLESGPSNEIFRAATGWTPPKPPANLVVEGINAD